MHDFLLCLQHGNFGRLDDTSADEVERCREFSLLFFYGQEPADNPFHLGDEADEQSGVENVETRMEHGQHYRQKLGLPAYRRMIANDAAHHVDEGMGLNVIGVNASEKFLSDLAGVTDPENKRKIIGRDFIEVFNEQAKAIIEHSRQGDQDGAVRWLAQGTIYPDRIESLNITGKVIKSHHNVGGLPEEMHLSLCEPLKWLFKDEVRRVGRELGMPEHLITRHPFPGPGLAVRILGAITPEKVRILQDADDIYIRGLREYKVKLSGEEARRVLAAGVPANMQNGEIEVSLYDQIWQAGTVLLSEVCSVGVMGDERTYENPVALRAVTSTDAMTADWAHLPYDFMAKISNEIINKVKGVNRVCYDISSKPPSTIEWE